MQWTYFQQLATHGRGARPGRDHLRARPARHGRPGKEERVRARVGPGRHVGRDLQGERAPVVDLQLRGGSGRDSPAPLRRVRVRVPPPARAPPPAAGLRPGAEALAHVQSAGCARRDRRDRAGGHGSRASAISPARWRRSTWSWRKEPMPSLLLEIGCEELPASACYEAERQLPEPLRRALRTGACGALHRPASAGGAPPRSSRARPSRSGSRGRRRRCASAPPPGSRAGTASIRTSSRCGTASWGSSSPGGRSGTSFRSASTPSSAASPSQDDALGRQRAALSAARSLGPGEARRGDAARRALFRPSLHAWGGGHPRRRRRTRTRLREAGVEPVAAARRRRILEGLPEGMERSRRRAGRGRPPGGVADRPGERLRRALPRPSSRRRDHRHAVPPALLPARGQPLRVRRERRRSGRRPRRNTQVLENRLDDAAFSFERDVKVGIDGLGDAPRGHLVLRRRRHVRRQGRAAAEARRAARWGRGDARGGAPRQGGPGLRARARVPGARGPHRRRVRAPGGISRGRLRRHRRAIPARFRPAGRCPRPRAGASSPPRTRSTR